MKKLNVCLLKDVFQVIAYFVAYVICTIELVMLGVPVESELSITAPVLEI